MKINQITLKISQIYLYLTFLLTLLTVSLLVALYMQLSIPVIGQMVAVVLIIIELVRILLSVYFYRKEESNRAIKIITRFAFISGILALTCFILALFPLSNFLVRMIGPLTWSGWMAYLLAKLADNSPNNPKKLSLGLLVIIPLSLFFEGYMTIYSLPILMIIQAILFNRYFKSINQKGA